MNKVNNSVSSFRAQHPKYFLASVCGGAVLLILFLTGGPTELRNSYAYPPAREISTGLVGESAMVPVKQDKLYPAIGPRDLNAAVERSEELWAKNLGKRTQFIKGKCAKQTGQIPS